MGFSETNRGNEDILVLKVSHFLTLAQGHLHMKIKLAFLINHWAIFNQILNVSLFVQVNEISST